MLCGKKSCSSLSRTYLEKVSFHYKKKGTLKIHKRNVAGDKPSFKQNKGCLAQLCGNINVTYTEYCLINFAASTCF